jgi:hypothetical protein
MKKMLFVATAFVALASFSSCKKTYVCTRYGTPVEYKDLSASQVTSTKAACELSGGTWSSK